MALLKKKKTIVIMIILVAAIITMSVVFVNSNNGKHQIEVLINEILMNIVEYEDYKNGFEEIHYKYYIIKN